MTVLDELPEAPKLNVKILATDIDPRVVATAKEATYSNAEIAGIPEPMKDRYLKKHSVKGGQYQVVDDVRSLISFGVLNLMEKLPVSGPFDAIFCRNVAIYFDAATQVGVWSKFIDLLGRDRCLFIGHSEQIVGPSKERVKRIGPTSFLKLA